MKQAVRRGEKIWVVRAGDGATVGEIVQRAKEKDAASAIREGRVFIGKKRATSTDQPVREGDTIRIGGGAEIAKAAPDILFHAHGLVAVNKPAGLPTVPDHAGAAHSLVAMVAAMLGEKIETLRITSRLDRDVSGVVVFALDADAEARLREARAKGEYKRRYVAIAFVQNTTIENAGVWDAPIGRAPNPRLRATPGVDPKPSTTRWLCIARATEFALLALDPITGRTHQIRLHAKHANAPLLGDRDYGGPTRLTLRDGRVIAPTRIALHAARVIVPSKHGEPIEARAPIPKELSALWSSLGGQDEAWPEATSK